MKSRNIINANPEMFVGEENVMVIIDLYNQFVEEQPTEGEMIAAINDLDPDIVGDFGNRVRVANMASFKEYDDLFFGGCYESYEVEIKNEYHTFRQMNPDVVKHVTEYCRLMWEVNLV
jgi:hypothetical protein